MFALASLCCVVLLEHGTKKDSSEMKLPLCNMWFTGVDVG